MMFRVRVCRGCFVVVGDLFEVARGDVWGCFLVVRCVFFDGSGDAKLYISCCCCGLVVLGGGLED